MVVDDVAFVVVESVVVVVVVKVGGKMLGLVVWCKKKKNVKPEVLEQAKVLALASVVVVVVVGVVFGAAVMEVGGVGALSIVIMTQRPTLDIRDSF